MVDIKEQKIELEIGVADFEHAFNRKPKDQKEYDDFFYACSRGVEAQLDWAIIVNCAKESME